MAKLQPWPEEATPLSLIIREEQSRLYHIFEVCLAEGIETQNYGLIPLLLTRLETRCRRILEVAKQLSSLIPKRSGRPPKWGEVAMDINALSSQILRVIERVRSECQTNRYITVARLLEIGRQKSQQIVTELDRIPHSSLVVVPAIFYQAFEGDDEG